MAGTESYGGKCPSCGERMLQKHETSGWGLMFDACPWCGFAYAASQGTDDFPDDPAANANAAWLAVFRAYRALSAEQLRVRNLLAPGPCPDAERDFLYPTVFDYDGTPPEEIAARRFPFWTHAAAAHAVRRLYREGRLVLRAAFRHVPHSDALMEASHEAAFRIEYLLGLPEDPSPEADPHRGPEHALLRFSVDEAAGLFPEANYSYSDGLLREIFALLAPAGRAVPLDGPAIPCPDWARFTRVDVVIECLPCGPRAGDVHAELLRLMPDAYDGPVPGEDDAPREPDHPAIAAHALSRVWDRLRPETQRTLIDAEDRRRRGQA